MKNILVIGSTGQIGSELTRELRVRYGGSHVVAGYIVGAEPRGELLESGPVAIADVADAQHIADVVREHHIDTIYNLAAFMDGDIQECIDRLTVAENAERLKESAL